MPPSFSTRRIAWDNVSFSVPARWDLAGYEFVKRLTRLRLEDDYAVRLQAEWTRFRRRPEMESIRRNYHRQARKMTHDTEGREELAGLPEGWSGFRYRMPGEADQVIAFGIPRGGNLFLFLRMHFGAEDKEPPGEVVRTLAGSLALHTKDMAPWEFYDFRLEVPHDYRLFSTELRAGEKHLVFQHRLRRLYLWQNSLADLALKTYDSPAAWAADKLNAARSIRGPKFSVGKHGGIVARRSKLHPFGHYDQLARACLKTAAFCRHDTDANRLYLWAFNYRRRNDLAELRGTFGPHPLNPEQPPL